MTEQEKKIAFVKRAAEMAGAKFITGPIWHGTDFWIGNTKIQVMATRLRFKPNFHVAAKPDDRPYSDIFPVYAPVAPLRNVLRLLRSDLQKATHRGEIPFRAIIFLTALLDYNPDDETDPIPT